MTYPTAEGLAIALRTKLAGVVYSNEYDLQEAISGLIAWHHVREEHLSDGNSRIDFLIPTSEWHVDGHRNFAAGIGIEVKINGSLSNVIRQLDRYAACPEIDELILITTRAKHHHIPRIIGARSIRVHLVSLVQNGL